MKTNTTDFTVTASPVPNWRKTKANLERWMLRRALSETGGNMAAAGRVLGITKVAVLIACRRHNIRSVSDE